ncbi:hypothetical protein BDP27DRAFT_1405788 [Rhodocollybia butyracea]|uniref:Uncharacterized protein n=1 Tax=Rhodocollybia butyracea TaxID=206335 RepID=A0A9P5PJZ8_9AGAR|nr:hypothetical protein BDP27DRAFT_1405788 [Rhodocollybia butyracea]
MSTVWFMVDDADPRFNYSAGSWTPLTLNATQLAKSNGPDAATGLLPNGPVFNNTLHETRDNASFTFRFNGSGFLGLYGTLDASGLLDPADIENTMPQVDCSLDGVGIGTPETGNLAANPGQNHGPANNGLFCVVQGSVTSISEDSSAFQPGLGEHVLQVAVTNFPGTMGWFFDYLTFESLPNPVVQDGDILQAGMAQVIDNVTDYSMLTFPESQGWVFDTNDFETLSGNHSNVTIEFNGTSLSMYGGLFGLNDNPFANGVYQVDKQNPVGFQVPILSSDASNQLIFTASDLDFGAHSMLVSFNISPSSQMQLDFFYINATASQLSSSSNTSSTSPGSSPSSPATALPLSSDKTKHPAVLIGAILGSIIPILLLSIGAIILWRRRSRRNRLGTLSIQAAASSFDYRDIPSSSHFASNEGLMLPSSSSKVHLSGENVPSTDGANSDSALMIKLQQRLVIMQDQLHGQQRERQPDSGGRTVPTVHIDSGLRLTGESALESEFPMEIPPGYTEQ